MDNKVIVITGASDGIGASFARFAASKGHRVVLAARRLKELEEVASACGNGAVAHVADVTRRAEVDRLREVAIKRCGHVDIWINNVGRGIVRQVLDLTDDDVDEIVNINLKSAIYGMQTIVPHFKERGTGQIINISSFLGRVPFASVRSIYSACKAALNSLTANLRMDLQPQYPEIRVSLVMPGMVSTAFHKNAVGFNSEWKPPSGNMPAPQTAEQVAEAIYSVIENPRAEIFTNPEHEPLAKGYFQDVAGFEQKMLAMAQGKK